MSERRYMVPTARPLPVDGKTWLSRWCRWVTGREGYVLGPVDPRLPLQLDARRPWHRDFLTLCLARQERVHSREWVERTHEKSGSLFWSLGSEIAFHNLDGVFFTTMDNKQIAALAMVDPRDPHRKEHALSIAVRACVLGVE